MDSKKALFRAKLREAKQHQEKRIDSALVRYNENDQPVCKVCNVTLKSESLWPAHQVSRKHREAIENMKALAKNHDRHLASLDQQKESEKIEPPSQLPSDVFDKSVIKKQTEEYSTVDQAVVSAQMKASSSIQEGKGQLPHDFFDQAVSESQHSELTKQPSKRVKSTPPEDFFETSKSTVEKEIPDQQSQRSSLKVNGALPQGFFDDKNADLRARGIQPVKVDVNDAYKEFEKEIQENLVEVDDRLEEEEIDAAEIRHEFELLEQREYRERVEMVKKKLVQAKAVKEARGQKRPAFERNVSSDDSSTDEEETTFTVDWRAKHL